MALPVPNLDDRRFQDLVDDAKRLVQQRCPEWTDHNVSDPGVTLRFRCDIEGVGVDPENPPLVWEAWDGYAWSPCEVDRDGTGGLNRDGDVVLHVPKSHTVSVIQQQRAGWLRARVLKPEPDQPTYSASPIIKGLTAFTIGGTAEAVNAELVENELLGVSEGVPGQGFLLKHRPVVPGGAANVLEVSGIDGWQ